MRGLHASNSELNDVHSSEMRIGSVCMYDERETIASTRIYTRLERDIHFYHLRPLNLS